MSNPWNIFEPNPLNLSFRVSSGHTRGESIVVVDSHMFKGENIKIVTPILINDLHLEMGQNSFSSNQVYKWLCLLKKSDPLEPT